LRRETGHAAIEHANFGNADGNGARGLVYIALDAWAGNEATLMDKDENRTARSATKPTLHGVITALFVIVFFLLVLLLGMSMVQHRFFQGERVHRNGSVGQ
jgi:hypothetical protein